MQTSDQPVPKGVYAQMRGISAARVSQYIAAGKIHGNAIVGEGRKAMIVPGIANEQLGVTLDLDQVIANGKPPTATMPTASAEPPPGVTAPPTSQTDLLAQVLNSDQRRAAKAKADSAEMTAERQRREMAAEIGRYMPTAEAQIVFRKRLGGVITGLDNALPDMAKAICNDLGIADVRAMTVALRQQFRAWRAKRAEQARNEGQDLSPFMADTEQPPDTTAAAPPPEDETAAEAPPQDE